MKCGLSNKILSTIFNITKSSIRRAIHSARQALCDIIVPAHLGFEHVTREEIIQKHTRKLAQDLLAESNDQAILVLDGTYIYINKSNNFQFQRRSFSMHKHRPLVKPMIIVSTTGYFVSVLGPYFADSKNNDASILKHILNNNIQEIKSWIDPSDICVVDRGFRDAIELMKELGIQAEMPAFMKRTEKQMTTDDANASRFVTKVRWVVEAANARIKRWKYLSHVLPTNQVPYIGDYVSIICALCNKYLPPINQTQELDSTLASQMRDRLSGNLCLQDFVEEHDLARRSVAHWTTTESLTDFPKLSETILRILTLGTYQLKLSSSYVQEYISGTCDFHLHKEIPGLLRVRLQSRHIASKSYLVWLKYDEDHVIAWYCKCRAGARTVGTCSHVAAVIWYLGMAVHTAETSFGVKDWGEYLEDASANPESIDSSDSEESIVEE
ncbi:uncharacterized protein LOC132713522 [Ruditapes philippinarum]|uniref:uncharacterized protein LOC132713522 n=1 Tax=Ruditapes philippinarum TaxID=129788 RepID=UPI00295B75A5|nr:uncharacterized protein LOC132713522 [Ruditapes philippinarum]